jgi:hypothetical protein
VPRPGGGLWASQPSSRWPTVSGAPPQSQRGVGTPGTFLWNRKARKPIFPVLAWTRAELSAFRNSAWRWIYFFRATSGFWALKQAIPPLSSPGLIPLSLLSLSFSLILYPHSSHRLSSGLFFGSFPTHSFRTFLSFSSLFSFLFLASRSYRIRILSSALLITWPTGVASVRRSNLACGN